MDVLLKATILATLFFVCYSLFLRKETFFQSNRMFLNVGLILTILLPWIMIPIYVTKPAPAISFETLANVQNMNVAQENAALFTWDEFGTLNISI